LDSQKPLALEPTAAHAFHDEPLMRERVLETSVMQLDELIGGFRSGQVALLDSDSSYSTDLLHILAVRAISQFDEEVVWIDGGNSIDPYSISSLCKKLGLDRREMLSMINVSRAFTAYQLVTLIDERLEEQVERCSPAAVVVSSITEMFLDKDMKWMESHQLLRRCLEDISRITREHETISVVTNNVHHMARPSPKLSALLYEHTDIAVQMRTRRNGMLVSLPGKDRRILFVPVPWNQYTLEEFGGDADGKDCAHIPLGP